MAELSRRGFITSTSLAGAAVAGGGLAAVATGAADFPARRHTGPLPESLVVHVRDLAKGEIALIAGTEEFIYTDAKLVAQLLGALAERKGR